MNSRNSTTQNIFLTLIGNCDDYTCYFAPIREASITEEPHAHETTSVAKQDPDKITPANTTEPVAQSLQENHQRRFR